MGPRITKDTPLVAGLRFYNGNPGFVGVPCRVVELTGDAVVYRFGQDGVRGRCAVSREVFVSAGHVVLAAGDPSEPLVVRG